MTEIIDSEEANELNSLSESANAFMRTWWIVPALVGAIAFLGWAWVTGWRDPIVAQERNQHRLNAAAIVPSEEVTLRQDFDAQHRGLTEIGLMFVRHSGDESEAAPAAQDQTITLQLRDSMNDNQLMRELTLNAADITHNQIYNWRFAPLWESADRSYHLHVSGTNNRLVTLWGFDFDVTGDGSLIETGGKSNVRDLRFHLSYQLGWIDAVQTLGRMVSESGAILLVTVLLCLLPGILLVPVNQTETDHWKRVGSVLAVGVAVWPVIWLWLTVLGGRWAAWSLWAVLIIGYVFIAWRWVRQNGRVLPRLRWLASPIALILLIGFALRLLAARDLVFPPWVDASRHALITAVMRDSGQILHDYEPYLPVYAPRYHFGFHTIPAAVTRMLGSDLAQTLLILGQLINALVPLTIYSAAVHWTGRRLTGFVAAFLVAIPFFFPGYYLSWGRFTQLTGMLILPILLVLTWQLTHDPKTEKITTGRFDWRNWIPTGLVALLSAGLFLVHFRVFLLYLPFVAVIVIWRRGAGFWRILAAGVAGGLLIVPRVLQLAEATVPSTVFTPIAGYNDFPVAYIGLGWEKQFLFAFAAALGLAALQRAHQYEWVQWALSLAIFAGIAIGEWLGSIPVLGGWPYARTLLACALLIPITRRWGKTSGTAALAAMGCIAIGYNLTPLGLIALFIGLFALIVASRWLVEAYGWQTPFFVLAVWVGALFFLLLGRRIGLPETWVINLNSMYISLFMPLALVLGMAFVPLWDMLRRRSWWLQMSAYLALGGLVMALTIYGVWTQVTLLNQETVLARKGDRAPLAWMGDNLPPDAQIAIGSWRWLGSTWAGEDGGSWIVPLTQLMTSTPPADYDYDRDLRRRVSAYNEEAAEIEDWSTPEAADLFREHGMTHIFIGERGGFLKADQLLKNDAIDLLFHQEGTFVFKVK